MSARPDTMPEPFRTLAQMLARYGRQTARIVNGQVHLRSPKYMPHQGARECARRMARAK